MGWSRIWSRLARGIIGCENATVSAAVLLISPVGCTRWTLRGPGASALGGSGGLGKASNFSNPEAGGLGPAPCLNTHGR